MKIKLVFTAVSFLLLTSFVQTQKTKVVTINTDNKEKILTKYTWQAEEIRTQLSNNKSTYYKRGGKNNTIDYGIDLLKFNANHSGTYSTNGKNYFIKWYFQDSKKTKMEILINFSIPHAVYLENINISNQYFTYVQHASDEEIQYLATVTRVPVIPGKTK